jgi:hypothetical protein
MTFLQAKVRRRGSSRQGKSLACSCPRRSQTTGTCFHFYGLLSYWTCTAHHVPQCPQFRYAQQVDTLGARYTYCVRTLGFSIAAIFSIKRGAGGLSISPNLTLRAVVSEASPAFQLLDSVNWLSNGDEMFSNPSDHVNWILQQLNTLFQDGKASPTDVTSDAKTLLAVCKPSFRPCKHANSNTVCC